MKKPSTSVQVDEVGLGRFKVTVTVGGKRYDRGEFPTREAAMQAGNKFAAVQERKDDQWDR